MNPNASAFVPRFGAKASTPAPAPTPVKTEEKPVEKPAEKKPAETPKKETWESEEGSSTFNPSEEEIKAELKRMEQEDASFKKDVEGLSSEVSGIQLIEDNREHINIVFIGHVDAGKSTISGQILFLTGQVDKRVIEKYEREAKDKNRESWYLAYIMDTNEEERAKGKTVEVGRAHFETKAKRYTILDAPGHKNYVPNMIGGAAQADIGILVVSARKGEFETGFDKGGQTREHVMVAKTLGLKYLIIVVNKMDDPTVEWSKDRWDEIVAGLTPYIKQVRYNIEKDVAFIPISGLKGTNIRDRVSSEVCPWYTGTSLLDHLDNLKSLDRLIDWPVRLPVIDKYRDGGKTWVCGKVETGSITKGQQLHLVPGKIPVEVQEVMIDDVHSIKTAKPGENVKVALKGIEEEGVQRGFVLTDPKNPIKCQAKFEAQVAVLDLLAHKSVFTAGYTAVLHIHTAVEECTITVLLDLLDNKTGQSAKKKPKFVTNGQVVRCMIECSQPVCLELFSDVPQLGRFFLRDEGKTIAIGKVTALGPKKKEAQ